MNIFVLDLDPQICAQYHCDKHVVKMIVESAQLLCSAHHVNGSDIEKDKLYKLTHKNHPCAVWVRDHKVNYIWLCSLALNLCKEYTHRYSKRHKTQDVIELLSSVKPDIFTGDCMSTPLCMPEQYRTEDVVKSYRAYYQIEKHSILKYTNREIPNFLKL